MFAFFKLMDGKVYFALVPIADTTCRSFIVRVSYKKRSLLSFIRYLVLALILCITYRLFLLSNRENHYSFENEPFLNSRN